LLRRTLEALSVIPGIRRDPPIQSCWRSERSDRVRKICDVTNRCEELAVIVEK
jgi:hypothetical protein